MSRQKPTGWADQTGSTSSGTGSLGLGRSAASPLAAAAPATMAQRMHLSVMLGYSDVGGADYFIGAAWTASLTDRGVPTFSNGPLPRQFR